MPLFIVLYEYWYISRTITTPFFPREYSSHHESTLVSCCTTYILLLLGNFPRIADPTQPSTTFPLNLTNLHSLICRDSLYSCFPKHTAPHYWRHVAGERGFRGAFTRRTSPCETRSHQASSRRSQRSQNPAKPTANKQGFQKKQGPRKKGVREVKLFRAHMYIPTRNM